MNASGTVLVIGGTGGTGAEAVRQLVLRDTRVRVVSRDPDRARSMAVLQGAEVVLGDSSVPHSLIEPLAGVQKVYFVPPTMPGWRVPQAEIIRLAANAGVQHMVRMSAIGAGRDEPSMSLSYHWQGEQDLEASGMTYTHIRPNSFFQNTLYDAETIKHQHLFYSCVGDTRFAKIDSRDIGEVVARVLTEDGHENHVYELTGPEALMYRDLAEVLSTALGHTIEYIDMTPEAYTAHLASAGYPNWMAEEFSGIYGRGFYRSGGGSYVTDTAAQLLGRPTRTFSQFAEEYAPAFRPSS